MGQGLLVAPGGVRDPDLLEPFTWTSGSCRSEGTTKQRTVKQTEEEKRTSRRGTVAVDGSRSLSLLPVNCDLIYTLRELFCGGKAFN